MCPFFNQENDSNPTVKPAAETLLSATVLEAIPDAVVAANQQGIIIQINYQTESMFGYTRDELIGQRVEILVP